MYPDNNTVCTRDKQARKAFGARRTIGLPLAKGDYMNIASYLDQVRAQYSSGQATEHSYRPALYALFESIDSSLTVVNEPKKSEGGMPDFLFQRGDVPFGWAEAKDIDKDVIRLPASAEKA